MSFMQRFGAPFLVATIVGVTSGYYTFQPMLIEEVTNNPDLPTPEASSIAVTSSGTKSADGSQVGSPVLQDMKLQAGSGQAVPENSPKESRYSLSRFFSKEGVQGRELLNDAVKRDVSKHEEMDKRIERAAALDTKK